MSRPISIIIVALAASMSFALLRPSGGPERADGSPPAEVGSKAEPTAIFAENVRPLLAKYCLDCHSTAKKKGKLDLERFASVEDVRRDLKPWQTLVEKLTAAEMPPEGKPQPTAEERNQLIAWTRSFIGIEAQARAGDPGPVPLRRLNNAEYNATIRDLTGIDLQPAREFPADGAAGEGFTNAAEALTEILPALLEKYLAAAKEIAAHAVLLPDGFRFSATKTRRDWTNEANDRLRRFYADYAADDGKLPLQKYLTATIRHRDAIASGGITVEAVAEKEKLNTKYLRTLWRTLTAKESSVPLDEIRAQWRDASDKDVKPLAAEIAAWQKRLWKIVPIGSYRDGNTKRQVPSDPAAAKVSGTLKKLPYTDQADEKVSGTLEKVPDTLAPPEDKRLLAGYADFRRCFPIFICYPHIIPVDEIVCLKQFHRDDDELVRLFLDDEQRKQLDRLWAEQQFISQWPLRENEALPLFIGFVTQDQPEALVKYYESQREPFRKRAEEFEQELEAAVPKQLGQVLDFSERAYRRPLDESEKGQLLDLFRGLRAKGLSPDEAFRDVLARVLVAPCFLFRVEHPPAGKKAGPVNDWELATRLSYFLWSSTPDDELRKLAASGKLHNSQLLEQQTRRMLNDSRIRALAIEFGTQWIQVRGFDEFKDKNETLFPTFDEKLRAAIYEESILFFQDLFQSDRPASSLLDADYTFLNETLAKHYGIPNVAGPEWRRVEGVKKYGRGGLLGLASVQAKESGASRTSPILRGNWIVETLLGEKLPRPPANVPKLPEAETGNDGLTMRQLVQKHTADAACAICHQRIDPFGFALEKYDAIGRLREKDLGGLAIDSHAILKDGTEFDGLDGLREYLLTKKRDVVVRLFCRRLLGYALGRKVIFSDQPLIDQMTAELTERNASVSKAILMIVQSQQFRSIRGSDYTDE